MAYKMRVLHCLGRRAQAARAAGRHVLLAGDFNIAPQPLDHCDPSSEFHKRADRRWLAALLSANHTWRTPVLAPSPAKLAHRSSDGSAGSDAPDSDAPMHGLAVDAGDDLHLAEAAEDAHGSKQCAQGPEGGCSACAHLTAVAVQLQQALPDPNATAGGPHTLEFLPCGGFVDTFRQFQPNRAEAYTCWNTATGARANNWGTRIDLLLAADPAPGADASPCATNSATALSADLQQAAVAATQPRPRWRWVDAMAAADVEGDRSGSDHAPAWLQVAVHAMATCTPASVPLPESAQSMLSSQGKQASLARLWLGALAAWLLCGAFDAWTAKSVDGAGRSSNLCRPVTIALCLLLCLHRLTSLSAKTSKTCVPIEYSLRRLGAQRFRSGGRPCQTTPATTRIFTAFTAVHSVCAAERRPQVCANTER